MQLRLAEVLGSLSLATDMSTASPAESSINATVISARLAERAGVPSEERPTAYFACLTRMLGCTATATESASLSMGHDQLFNHGVLTCDWSEPDQVAVRLRDVLPEGDGAGTRDAAIQGILDQFDGIGEAASLHCLQAQMLTARLPVPAGVSDLLGFIWSRWDGRFPGAAGSDIPLAGRVITLARGVELARRAGGQSAAEAVAQARGGTEFDPELCDLFLSCAPEILGGLDGATGWDVFLDSEPGAALTVDPEDVVTIAEAFADFADQKSGWFLGHSRRVSALATAAAGSVGLDQNQQDEVTIASLLHDVGCTAVPNGIWDKPGELSPHERQLAESHSYHTDSVLKMSSTFAGVAAIAAAAHERADGSGYHRAHHAVDAPGALLASADVYDALVSDRPWRPAFSPDNAVAEIQRMCADGALHPECAAAVLSVARGGETVEVKYPDGLTNREVDVIKLLVTGSATKTIAGRLSISPKTADKHIQSVYDKTKARGRAPVALYALRHGLMAP
jgi:HD-GYP domain-containing protein (c-di-GMP phosphodiesterase class II)